MEHISDRNVTVLSFFSGCGMLDMGFEDSGFDIAYVNEFSEDFFNAYVYARERMGRQVPSHWLRGDVNEVLDPDSMSSHEVRSLVESARAKGLVGFIGGPPCPDFSVAGKNRGSSGDNGRLTQSYADVIRTYLPDFFLFENVKGLWRTKKHREFYERIKRELQDCGYCTTEKLVNALDFGAPQDRERIMLFGIRSDLLPDECRDGHLITNFDWDAHTDPDAKGLKDAVWPTTDRFVKDSVTECPPGVKRQYTVQYWFDRNDVEHHPNAGDFFLPRAGITKMFAVDEGDVSRKSYKRLHRWRYSPTVAYGNNEVHLHPYKVRRISVAEALSLQSMPREFVLPPDMSLSAKFKTVGNGVPYLLGRGVAETIRDYLDHWHIGEPRPR